MYLRVEHFCQHESCEKPYRTHGCEILALRCLSEVWICSTVGTDIVKKVIAHMLRMLDIRHTTSTVYRPSTQEQLERQHESVAASVFKLSSERQTNQSEIVLWQIFAVNAALSARTGVSGQRIVYVMYSSNRFDTDFLLRPLILSSSIFPVTSRTSKLTFDITSSNINGQQQLTTTPIKTSTVKSALPH